ncbi:hypothetical protein BGZ70_007848 [Mortierella alpina]|uniref:tRNA/rRNA methyltransferase SpoU type domain-containing protein n=1 Tax=Mortierella alpina TaxID=64518 RepID=A0A9P6M283_MORAP|nr:hypothetical protein BGZ70_007848 [Mortierella alpina]
MNSLPSRFLRITAPKNQLLRRLERLRTSKDVRQEEGHVVVQGIKTLQELASKGHTLRTIGITFDEHNLPIRTPALDIIESMQQEETAASTGREGVARDHASAEQQRRGGHDDPPRYHADQYVAVPRSLTTKILGTDSPTSDHEVFAEVAIPNFRHLFSSSPTSTTISSSSRSQTVSRRNEIKRLLVLDKISDPGNMGLLIRSAKALFWHAAWHTPGTVDPYNNKVVRASRALCLDWPVETGGWRRLERFLEDRGFTLVVADMMPRWIQDQAATSTASSTGGGYSRHNLVWWNWPSSLPRSKVPARIALVMSSEHHGVASRSIATGDEVDSEQELEVKARERLLSKAIKVSIPMNPAVESMNVAAAATAMMWELNRVMDKDEPESMAATKLQIFDAA